MFSDIKLAMLCMFARCSAAFVFCVYYQFLTCLVGLLSLRHAEGEILKRKRAEIVSCPGFEKGF